MEAAKTKKIGGARPGAGRPKVENPKVQVSCTLPPGFVEALDKYAQDCNISRSEALSELAATGLQSEERYPEAIGETWVCDVPPDIAKMVADLGKQTCFRGHIDKQNHCSDCDRRSLERENAARVLVTYMMNNALCAIFEMGGWVCDDYPGCGHVACQNSWKSRQIAQETLDKVAEVWESRPK